MARNRAAIHIVARPHDACVRLWCLELYAEPLRAVRDALSSKRGHFDNNVLTPSLLPGDGRTSVHACTCPQPQYRPRGAVFLAGGLGRDLKLARKAVKYSVLSQLFCVNAGSSLSIQTDLQPDKVASTCSERLAQLDPHCPPMLLAACKRSRAGADACRLSLASMLMLPSMLSAVCKQTQGGGDGASQAIVVCHIVI